MKFMKKSKLFKILLSLALAACVLAWSNTPVMAFSTVSGNYYWVYKITNKGTGNLLNVWTTDVNSIYNGCPVTTFDTYCPDGTQWFRMVEMLDINGCFSYNIMSYNTNYSLNIGYRGEGSNSVMYQNSLDLETWEIKNSGLGYKIILKSNPNVWLAENPNTHEVYLTSTNSKYCYWKFTKVGEDTSH